MRGGARARSAERAAPPRRARSFRWADAGPACAHLIVVGGGSAMAAATSAYGRNDRHEHAYVHEAGWRVKVHLSKAIVALLVTTSNVVTTL